MGYIFSSWRLLYRVPWLVLHMLVGLPLTLLSYLPPGRVITFRGRSLNEAMHCWFAARTCQIFGLRRRVQGAFLDGPSLIAANHISWIDIQLLHSISPMGFVAKAEIEQWPVAGWLARVGDTVFHRRGSHDSASNVLEVMTQRLEAGRKVAVFAEGGIHPGYGVKHFHARLFAAAIDTKEPVQPVMLRYMRQGRHYEDITFRPGEHFAANFFRLLCQPGCNAEVNILPVINPDGKQRRELANEAQAAVEMAFGSESPE